MDILCEDTTIVVVKRLFLISKESRWTERKANPNKMSAKQLNFRKKATAFQ